MKTAKVNDLAMLVKQLSNSLNNYMPNNPLSEKAVRYLKDCGLIGSIMREEALKTSSKQPQD